MLILFSIFFPLVIGSVCVLVNGNKISKAKPSGKTILVDNKNYSFEMDMENFISYVLMAQMDESEPEELLKAKSVIIRTYILYKMKDKTQIAYPARPRCLGLGVHRFEDGGVRRHRACQDQYVLPVPGVRWLRCPGRRTAGHLPRLPRTGIHAEGRAHHARPDDDLRPL